MSDAKLSYVTYCVKHFASTNYNKDFVNRYILLTFAAQNLCNAAMLVFVILSLRRYISVGSVAQLDRATAF